MKDNSSDWTQSFICSKNKLLIVFKLHNKTPQGVKCTLDFLCLKHISAYHQQAKMLFIRSEHVCVCMCVFFEHENCCLADDKQEVA